MPWFASSRIALFAMTSLVVGVARAEDCPVASMDGLFSKAGRTQPPSNALPSPATNNDCAFYNGAWNAFLAATQPGKDGRPAFLSFPTIEAAFPRVFGKTAGPTGMMVLTPRNVEPMMNERKRAQRRAVTFDDGIAQAAQGGEGAILVDQNRNPVSYAINVNDRFKDFVAANRLDDIEKLFLDPSKPADQAKGAISADLEFRPGSMELKSSWMIVEGDASRFKSYMTVRALVPAFKNVGSQVAVDYGKPLRRVTVALLGLHVVVAIDGHPEFVWASFEHADAAGHRDLAPAAMANPDPSGHQAISTPAKAYPLFGKSDAIDQANQEVSQSIGADQKFPKPTPIYRIFPGSQSTKPSDGLPDSPWEDPAVFSLNEHIGEMFSKRDPRKLDVRRNYRLLGAVWIDQPRAIAPAAADGLGGPLADAAGQEVIVGQDGKLSGPVHDVFVRNFSAGESFTDDDSRFAGENRLSNVSIESFTQPSGTGAPNCFSCHDTSAQDAFGVPGRVLWPRRINVSHVFTIAAKKFLAGHKP